MMKKEAMKEIVKILIEEVKLDFQHFRAEELLGGMHKLKSSNNI
jgi:hypothetical protein